MKAILKTIIGFFIFCIKPNWANDNNKTIVKLISTVFFVLLIILTNQLIVNIIKQLPNHYLLEFKRPLQSSYMLVFAFFIGPIIEEIIFRLPLIYSRLNISLAIGVLIGFFITPLFIPVDSIYLRLLIKLIAAIIAFGLLYVALKYFRNVDNSLNKFLSKYRIIVFYLLALIFCLIHISNIRTLSADLFVIILLYLIPKFILGLICSYIRIKFGVKYSMLAHIGNNTFGSILIWLK